MLLAEIISVLVGLQEIARMDRPIIDIEPDAPSIIEEFREAFNPNPAYVWRRVRNIGTKPAVSIKGTVGLSKSPMKHLGTLEAGKATKRYPFVVRNGHVTLTYEGAFRRRITRRFRVK